MRQDEEERNLVLSTLREASGASKHGAKVKAHAEVAFFSLHVFLESWASLKMHGGIVVYPRNPDRNEARLYPELCACENLTL